MRKNRIAFTGPFADINFGDYAMLVNNIYDIEIENIILFTYDSSFLDKIKKDYLEDFEVNIVDVELIKTDYEKIVSEEYIYTPLELLTLIKNYKELINYMEQVDQLIVNGGGYFNELWCMPHRIEKLLKIIAPILVANQLGKNILFTGNGFGPFGSKSAQFLSSFFCSLNNVIFNCRDNLYSPMWLRQIGVAPELIANVPDDLLFPNKSFQNKKNPVNKRKYIVLETYLPVDYIQKNIEIFRSFSYKLYNNYNLEIIFLPFNLEWGGMDQGLFLNEKLNHFELFDINQTGYLRIENALSIIENAELIICSRYHALVVALEVHTPVVSVIRNIAGDKRYHYNKNGGILRNFFAGIPIDEKNYIRLDYLEALDYIINRLPEIISIQKENFKIQSEQSDINKKMLDQRKTLFGKLKDR